MTAPENRLLTLTYDAAPLGLAALLQIDFGPDARARACRLRSIDDAGTSAVPERWHALAAAVSAFIDGGQAGFVALCMLVHEIELSDTIAIRDAFAAVTP
jgi:hypothetical protein